MVLVLGGGTLAEAHKACTCYAPKVKNSLPKTRRTRERGARESRASGLSGARAVTRTCSRKENFGLRRSCSQPQASVQLHKAKRNSLGLRKMKVGARSCQRSFAQPLAAFTCRP